MVTDPGRRGGSPLRTVVTIVVGIIFIIGLFTLFRWIGSVLSMGFFVVIVVAFVAIVVLARRR